MPNPPVLWLNKKQLQHHPRTHPHLYPIYAHTTLRQADRVMKAIYERIDFPSCAGPNLYLVQHASPWLPTLPFENSVWRTWGFETIFDSWSATVVKNCRRSNSPCTPANPHPPPNRGNPKKKCYESPGYGYGVAWLSEPSRIFFGPPAPPM